ncbi:MAG: RimK family protein [Flavobacteriaceae bacterium]
MTGWVIIVDRQKDFPNADTPHKVITAREYLARPQLFSRRPKVINLARSYTYQSRGYYCSLLAEARGHRVMPTVESMLDLSERDLYAHAVPELEDAFNRQARKVGFAPVAETQLYFHFGEGAEPALEKFGRLLFDWFRCPVLEVTIAPGDWLSIKRIQPRSHTRLDEIELARFRKALDRHTVGDWRSPRQRPALKYSLAVLHDPAETLAPSSRASLKHFARVAEKHDIEVDLITRKQYHQLAEYDALFIRETTSIDNHTYRFARRATQETMPVIDDPVSMIRCTNKVYLKELLTSHGIAVPPTVIISSEDELDGAVEKLGLPLVVKIPDGSFSRGVHKVESKDRLVQIARDLFRETDLLIAQKFMPTEFDWRVGVLGGRALFVCQYLMAKQHWQIVKHDTGGAPLEGGFKTCRLVDAPPEVIETGVQAARLIGDGLYGVDIKQTPDGVFVIEVNDNPNIEHGVEDAAEKEAVWAGIARWFLERLER